MIKLPLRTFAGLALASACTLFSASQSQAQNANVNVSITLNPITILYYYSTVNVTIPSTALAALLCSSPSAVYNTSAANCDIGASGLLTAANNAGTLEANGAIAAPAFNASAVPLTLQNVWSVRALGGASANTTVQISAGPATSITSGAASIALANFQVQSLPAVAGATVTFADPGLGTARSGDVLLTLDLTNATLAAPSTYSSAGANYVLTISGT